MCIYSFLRYPGTGILELLDELENPELKVLTSKLPNTVLRSHADNTDGGIQKMGRHEQLHNLKSIPVKLHLLTLHLQDLVEQSKSKAALEEPCNALC